MADELTWGLPVITYLFLAGAGAGATTVSASMLLRGGPNGNHFAIARYGAFLGPIPVMVGSMLLIYELGSFHAGHLLRFLNLYMGINLSPMSIGTWLLTLFLAVSVVYAYTFLKPDAKPGDEQDRLRKSMAWICIPLGIGVAVYTGVLLGAMPSRPFWNSPILAMLFLVSALSTGVAGILLLKSLLRDRTTPPEEARHGGYLLAASDSMLIGLELLVIFLFVMFAHLTVGNVGYAIQVILGGSLTAAFWIGVVVFGLLIPAVIELRYVLPKLIHHKEFVIPRGVEIAVPVIVLSGGFLLRYVIVIAGQVTGPVGI